MSYKLLNKNIVTATVVSLLTLGVAKNSSAQGVVSLVDEKPAAAQANVQAPTQAPAPADSMEMDISLPTTLENTQDVIPLDTNGENTPNPIANAPKTAAGDGVAAPVPAPQSNSAQKNVSPEAPDFDADMDFSLGVENETPENQPDATAANAEKSPLMAPKEEAAKNPVVSQDEKFGEGVLSKINDDLFNQMSDIEKQTTLLTLELKREKVRNEIEAIKAQRTKAIEEKRAAEEEKKRKEFEWQKEQEAKVLREQQILKEKEIELEKLKQKKALNAYMNKMLEQNQKWIADNAAIYKQMRQIEEDRKALVDNFKKKLENLTILSNKAVQSANNAKSNHDRTLASLTAQNIQLKKRIEADELAAKNRQQNPFSGNGENDSKVPVSTSIDAKITPINIAKEYAIMEITGQGDNLVAKLINKNGESFLAREGTVLQTGHAIEDITPRYIQFDRNGLKDYLYTTGSAMTMEPDNMEGTATTSNTKPAAKPVIKKKESSDLASSKGVPSLGTGMFVK